MPLKRNEQKLARKIGKCVNECSRLDSTLCREMRFSKTEVIFQVNFPEYYFHKSASSQQTISIRIDFNEEIINTIYNALCRVGVN